MNLAVLKKTRRAPEVGDIFVMQPPDGQFLFGRVVDTNADPLGVGGAVLVYIYRIRAAAKTPVPKLFRGQLLVPPMMTNKQPWTKGYFEHVENRPLSAMDRLPQHCFKDTRGWYFVSAPRDAYHVRTGSLNNGVGGADTLRPGQSPARSTRPSLTPWLKM